MIHCFLGASNENVPKIVSIFGEAFFRDAMEPTSPVGIKMLNIVRQIQSNEVLFQNIVSALRPELQQALHMALQATPSS